MLRHMPVVSLPQTKSCGFFLHSSHVRRRYARVNICKSYLSSVGAQASKGSVTSCSPSRQKGCSRPVAMTAAVSSVGGQWFVGLSVRRRSLSLRLCMPACEKASKVSWNTRATSWMLGGASVGLCLRFSTTSPVYAEAMGNNSKSDAAYSSCISSSHGKKVYTDYSITGIPGDGRCLFRSVAHGACNRSGKPLPDEALQRELADELRAKVADEFIKRRAETEWFIEGDFDSYVSQIRKPHVWGGEPELFMASHVLRMPITVYMHDEDSGGLITIAEYGQEYGKEDPIRVLYHGFGHYDALQIPAKKGAKSRL